MLKWFSKKVQMVTPIQKAQSDILVEYQAAHSRQKSIAAKPTEYMRGLRYALDKLEERMHDGN